VPDPKLVPELESAELSRWLEQVPADSELELELERERELVQVASEPDLGA
jgi:hypothetical protein